MRPFNVELQELAGSESGIGFIYAALNLLAQRYHLSDAAVVLADGPFGTQIFRLNGRAVDRNSVGELGASPGVHSIPDTVPRADLDALFSACSSEFARHVNVRRSRNEHDDTELPRDPFRIVETSPPDLLNAVATSPRRRAEPWRARASSSRATVARTLVSRLLALVDVTVLVMTVAGVHGPARLLLGLVLGVVIPGWCVVAPLRLNNPPLELGLTLALSLSLLMLVAQILITFTLWHLVALEEITSIVCLPPLLYLSNNSRSWRRHSR